MNSNTLLYYNRVVPLSKSSLCYIVSDRRTPNIPATGILPAITNGRTKKCLPSGEPVSRKRETLSRMTGHECDRRNVKSANVVDASSSVMFVLPVIEAIKRFHVGDFRHVQRSGGGRSAVGRLRHGQQRGVNVVRHFHTLSRFEVVF